MIKGSDYHRIEKAIGFLMENMERQPSLEDLSGFLGLSEFHCHRLFKKWAGITPKDFLQFLTLARAKELLKNSSSLVETSLNVGLSGPSRLHDLFIRYEAMTPGEYKNGGEGLEIGWSHFDTIVGPLFVAATRRGICSLSFQDKASDGLKLLKESWPNARLIQDAKFVAPFVQAIDARLRGEKNRELCLFVKGTPFQVKVWEALLNIPEGKISTYREIAHLIGSPKAVRAVGSAIGANPIGFLIPCHRVIRSSGAIGDYHWGPARKTALLAIEYGRKNDLTKREER